MFRASTGSDWGNSESRRSTTGILHDTILLEGDCALEIQTAEDYLVVDRRNRMLRGFRNGDQDYLP